MNYYEKRIAGAMNLGEAKCYARAAGIDLDVGWWIHQKYPDFLQAVTRGKANDVSRLHRHRSSDPLCRNVHPSGRRIQTIKKGSN